MKLRTRFYSAALAATAFVMTPSPVTQGQANGIGLSYHVDDSLLSAAHSADAAGLDGMDAVALAEVERIFNRRD